MSSDDNWHFGGGFAPYTETPTKKECLHIWVLYTGILEEYRFCEKCDLKKEKSDDASTEI